MNKKQIKEFRKKFCIESGDSEDIWLKKSDGKPVVDLYLRWDIEQFISKLLKEQKEEFIRKLKKIQENPDKLRKRLASDIYKKQRGKKGEAFNKAHNIAIHQFPYNLGIDRAIKIIKSIKRLQFDKVNHIYYLDGKLITGATTILRNIAAPFLIPWAANMATEHIVNNSAYDSKTDFYAVEKSVLEEARKAHTKKKEDAADIGKITHKILEDWINGKPEENKNYNKLNDKDKKMVDVMVSNFINWADSNKVEFLESEKRVYSEKYWYAGTFDFVAVIKGKTYLGDIKTSSGIFPSMWAQCAAYATALEECEGKKVNSMVIVNTKKDGSIQVKYSTDFDGFMRMFLGALLIHRQQNKIKRGAAGIGDFLKNAWVVQKRTPDNLQAVATTERPKNNA